MRNYISYLAIVLLMVSCHNSPKTAKVEVPAMDGLDLPYSANVSIQAAVGLPKNTELIVRFVPNMASSIDKLVGSDDVIFNDLSIC